MKNKISNSNIDTLESQYKHELRNLKSRIRYHRKKGLDIRYEDVIPQHDTIDKYAIEELKNIKAEEILTVSTIPDEPYYNYITAVEELIDELPNEITTYERTYNSTTGKHPSSKGRTSPVYTDLSDKKDELFSALYDTLAEYDNSSLYNDYLSRVYSEIQRKLTPLNYPSDDSQAILGMIGDAIALIQGHPLSMEQAIMANDYTEMLN